MKNRNLIGVGFLGSGFARKVQAPAFQTIPDVKLIGVASPNNAEDFARDFGMDFHTKDYRELIQRDDVDLICITTPPKFHFEQTLYALNHNKHILCEKPFTMNMLEATQLFDRSIDYPHLTLVDHELRLSPVRKYAKSLIPSLGRIYYASAISCLTSRNNKSTPFSWWFEAAQGGGAWGAIGSHLIDQLRFFCGEIRDVEVMLDAAVKERKDHSGIYHRVTADEIASAVLRFEGGFTGMISCIMVAPENRLDIEIIGESGSMKIDIDGRVFLSLNNEPYQEKKIPLSENEEEIQRIYESSGMLKNKFSNAFIYAANEIISAIREGKRSIPDAATFKDGLEIQKILDKGWGHSFNSK